MDENEEQVNNPEIKEPEQETISMKDIVKKMSELISLEMQDMKLTAAIAARSGKELVQNKVEQAKDGIINFSNQCGQNAQNLARNYVENKDTKSNILKEYESVLATINQEYDEYIKIAMETKANAENKQENSIIERKKIQDEKREYMKTPEYKEYLQAKRKLKREIADATKKEDTQTLVAKTQELDNLIKNSRIAKYDKDIEAHKSMEASMQTIIEQSDDLIDSYIANRTSEIESATAEKNQSLSSMKKQNFMQKILGSIINKFSGTKKLEQYISTKVKGRIEKIKTEVIPKVSEKLNNGADRLKDLSSKVGEKTISIAEGSKQMAVESYLGIVQKTNKAKSSFLQYIIQSLASKQAKLAEKSERLNPQQQKQSSKEPSK